MKPIHRHVTRFWSEERSLTAFLILLVVEIFVIAPMQFTGLAFKLLNSLLHFLNHFFGEFYLHRGIFVCHFGAPLLRLRAANWAH